MSGVPAGAVGWCQAHREGEPAAWFGYAVAPRDEKRPGHLVGPDERAVRGDGSAAVRPPGPPAPAPGPAPAPRRRRPPGAPAARAAPTRAGRPGRARSASG